MATTAQPTVPTGTLRQVALKDIKRDVERFRKDFTGLEMLVESIKDKGVLQPVTLTPDFHILAGERRIRAAELAGLDKIPALIRKVDGDVDAREIELIENTFRVDFTWQEKTALVAEIDRLYKAKNIDWSGRKTAQLLNKSTTDVARTLEMARAIEAIPELGQQATANDAYKMLKKFEEQVIVDELVQRQQARLNPEAASSGEHLTAKDYAPSVSTRLRNAETNYVVGDTFKGLAELPSDGQIHIIECDPPYGINLTNVKGSKDNVDTTIHGYEEVPADKYAAFLNQLAVELYRVANRDAWLVFWYGPTWHTEVREALKKAGWLVDDIPAIWVKPNGQTLQPELYFARCYEPFFLARKGKPVMAMRGRSNVFLVPPVAAEKKYHPTERPAGLIKQILTTLGLPGQTVLVPFLGSGATLRACYGANMLGLGWDMNPQYKDRFMLAVEDDATRAQAAESAEAAP